MKLMVFKDMSKFVNIGYWITFDASYTEFRFWSKNVTEELVYYSHLALRFTFIDNEFG